MGEILRAVGIIPATPSKGIARCSLAWDKARLGAQGRAGEKFGLFEHPAGVRSCCDACVDHRSFRKPQQNFQHPASPACRPRRSYADDFLILLNVARKKRRIPCQDRDLVDFMQVIR